MSWHWSFLLHPMVKDSTSKSVNYAQCAEYSSLLSQDASIHVSWGNATLTLLIATFVQQSIRLCELRRPKPNTKQNNSQQNPTSRASQAVLRDLMCTGPTMGPWPLL